MLVARGLGPGQFGTMMFLLGTFTALRGLLDMGSSTAFFTFLSQRQRSSRFVIWFFRWLGFQFLLTLLTVGLLFPNSWIELIWKNEQRQLVILAFVASYMQSVLWSVFLQMGESQRLTRLVQGVALIVALVHLLLVLFALWIDWMSVSVMFSIIFCEWVIAVAVVAKQLRFQHLPRDADTGKSIFKEFSYYCRPLIIYSWIGFAYEFADRWLLQTYGGSEQQAYFSVASQFAAITAIATSSILNIFWKEIAEAHNQNNNERVALLYKRVSRGLYFVAAVGAGFLVPWAEEILSITLGVAYIGGASTLMMMFYYPLHQSMGQIGGAMAYATGQVSVHVKIGIAFMVSSIVLSYFVLANADSCLPGLGLGAYGLAIKMLIMQIISVNALAYFISKRLNIKLDWQFQLTITALCSGAGIFSYELSNALLIDKPLFPKLFISGLAYTVILVLSIYLFPWLLSMKREDLVNFIFEKRPI
jgi:O-antigen/teichoic acid export membrane protein